MKKNKNFIWISIMICLVLFIVILNSTVFCVKTISLDFMTTQVKVTDSNQVILANCLEKEYGSIFFVNKPKMIEAIQSNYPYIGIVNIESIFPNQLIIHAIERQPFYALQSEDGVYVCDQNLGIIEKVLTMSPSPSNPILLEGITFEKNQTIGMELTTTKIENIKNLSYYLLQCDKDIADIKAIFSKIQVDYLEANQLCFSTFDGVSILIEDCQTKLSNKLHCAYDYYQENELTGGTIKVTKNGILVFYK